MPGRGGVTVGVDRPVAADAVREDWAMSGSEWGKVGAGDHACVAATANVDRLASMVDCADAGLHHGDKTLFFTDDPTPAELTAALATGLPDGEAALRRGQVRVTGAREAYLPDG